MKILKSIISFLALTAALTACNANPLYQGEANSPESQKRAGEPGGPIFQMVSSQVIEPQCLRCHSESGGNRGGVNLEGYNNVRVHLSAIQREVSQGTMPPRGPLEQSLKDLILKWIELGAPES